MAINRGIVVPYFSGAILNGGRVVRIVARGVHNGKRERVVFFIGGKGVHTIDGGLEDHDRGSL